MNGSTTAATNTSHSRLLKLEGGCNFRDIGGYAAGNGQSVKWRQVYRTGVLSYFTSNDHPALLNLGVRAICDLRRVEEREREPTRWPDAAVQALSWVDDASVPTIRGFAARQPATAAGMRAAMIEVYRALPAWMGPRISGLFECIEAGNAPVIVHCAAGKDRTGVAIAVLLGALGVAHETIVADYLLTNQGGNFEQFILTHQNSHLGLADTHDSLLSMPQDMRRVLFAADADYLQAALDQIDTGYGGLESYLESCAQVDRRTLQRVRERLLT